MTIQLLLFVLVVLSAATYLLMGAAKLYLKSIALRRSSEIVTTDRTVHEIDARPSEVVTQEMAVSNQVSAPIKETNCLSETLTKNIDTQTQMQDLPTLPTTAEGWRAYDEPTCLRRGGSEFVMF